jgi:hypothetical protein
MANGHMELLALRDMEHYQWPQPYNVTRALQCIHCGLVGLDKLICDFRCASAEETHSIMHLGMTGDSMAQMHHAQHH